MCLGVLGLEAGLRILEKRDADRTAFVDPPARGGTGPGTGSVGTGGDGPGSTAAYGALHYMATSTIGARPGQSKPIRNATERLRTERQGVRFPPGAFRTRSQNRKKTPLPRTGQTAAGAGGGPAQAARYVFLTIMATSSDRMTSRRGSSVLFPAETDELKSGHRYRPLRSLTLHR